MSKINIETQLKSLYDKAQIKKQQSTPEDQAAFNETLRSSIERMNQISHQADDAYKALANPKENTLKEEIAQAGNIHQRIMEEQHNLAALYKKIKIE